MQASIESGGGRRGGRRAVAHNSRFRRKVTGGGFNTDAPR